MSLRFFEGPAGSGKTTRIFEELAWILEACPLGEHQRVLALTKMHGSRRRMQGRLAALPGLRGRFECITIDSFAWHMVQRWRSLARTSGGEDLEEGNYEQVCALAGRLLAEDSVGRWTTRTFPLIVVDEMQDSKGGQLEIVRALSKSAACIAAADDFQDLDATGENVAVAWARETGEIEALIQNHRTLAAGLLAAARDLRAGKAVPYNGDGFTVLGAQNHNVGASYVSNNLTWWHGSGDMAVITPVRPEKSQFVHDLIARVEQGPIGKKKTGPHRIPWETAQEDECDRFLVGLQLPGDASAEVCASSLSACDGSGPSKALHAWLDQQRLLAGRTTFRTEDILQQARRIHQRSRAHRRVRDQGIRAMTIHQAKNREFDSVIVLWPYEVAGSAERQRRLLYNAITRAKRQALVVVQSPKRLTRPPFVPDDGDVATRQNSEVRSESGAVRKHR